MIVEHVKTVTGKEDPGYTSFNDRLAMKLSDTMGMMAMLQSSFARVVSQLNNISRLTCDLQEKCTERMYKLNKTLNLVSPVNDIMKNVSNLTFMTPTLVGPAAVGAGGALYNASELGSVSQMSKYSMAVMPSATFYIIPKAVVAVTSGIMGYVQAEKADCDYVMKLNDSINTQNTKESKETANTMNNIGNTNASIARTIRIGYEVEKRVTG